jgi:hypothetical protein
VADQLRWHILRSAHQAVWNNITVSGCVYSQCLFQLLVLRIYDAALEYDALEELHSNTCLKTGVYPCIPVYCVVHGVRRTMCKGYRGL